MGDAGRGNGTREAAAGGGGDAGIIPLRGRRGHRRATAGSVALVGAGPGDPELLTLKAARLIAACDVLVYDRLAAPEIVALAQRAEKIYVGKAASDHAMPQSAICALLVREAAAGRQVVRLKGGDPYVFGRGGEEAEALAAAGIPFDVVPGITAACGIGASAGIPLTHRDHAQTLTFVTAHLKDGTMNLDWPALARPHQTLCVYMGLAALPQLCRELVAHGLPATTPAAIVERGTTAGERVVTGTLADLPARAQTGRMKPPTLIIVGTVVALRSTLAGGLGALAAAAPLAVAAASGD